MIEFLDLPKYLSEHGNKEKDVKIVCILDRQIEMPEHLKSISDSSNMAALVDVVGIDIQGKKYIMKGKSVVILGPRAFEPVLNGKKVLVLTGNALLKEDNYVEITLIYPTKNNNGFSLYATRTLYRDIPSMRNAYPDFMKYMDKIAQMGWNLDLFYSNFQIPLNYRVSCGDCEFRELSEKEKFVYKSDEEYRKHLEFNKPVQNSGYSNNYSKNYNNSVTNRNHIKQRKGIVEMPESFKTYENIIQKSEDKVLSKIAQLDRIPKRYNIENAMAFTYHQLKTFWKYSPDSDAVTGRALMKNVLEHMFPEYKGKYVGSKLLIDDALDYKNVLDIWYDGEIPEYLEKNQFYREVKYKREEIYIAFIDYILGLRQKLVNAYYYGKSLEIDMFSVIRFNPYYLSLIDNRLNIEDLDKLSLLYKVDLSNSEVQKFRNAAYLHNYLLNPNNESIEDNTIVLKDLVMRNIANGYVISSASYKSLQTNDCILTDKILSNLQNYIVENMNYDRFSLPQTGWSEIKVKGISKYVRPITNQTSNELVIRDYIDSGLGLEISFDNQLYLMDYSYAYKERFIIRKLYSLYENGDKPYLNPTNIESCIRGFEAQKAIDWNMPSFKLEERQADAVRMLHNPVMCLTGPAGSGKTTTAEAILYGLQALLGIEENSIMFCAPTGKAAQRLKEIVKKPTQTIHSLFTIGSESFNILGENDKNKKYDIKVLIVDEASMINLELMYNMMQKISDKTRIIFMGDIEQLPPIGAGKPFYNILGFLPSVILDVTKRASANSGITKNAEEIIYHSDVITDELKQYDDFRILEVNKDNVVKLVSGIVNYHLGGAGEKRTGNTTAASRVLQSLDVDLVPDDIQVISPVRKKYDWGTDNLNVVLQDVFNPRKSNQKVLKLFLKYDIDNFSNEKIPVFLEYRLGDRVIHTENNYNMQCFLRVQGSKFSVLSDKQGIMNGADGKISGFYFGSELDFVDEAGNNDKSTKDSFANNDDVIYLAVDYEGITSKGVEITYTVFYQCENMDNPDFNSLKIKNNAFIVDSLELRKLELAYALTVHKIQGSQAKLIICVMYPIRYSDFISRNMIYTSITRAVSGIYLVGNVLGYNSVVNRGRKIEQTSRRLTALDKIFM